MIKNIGVCIEWILSVLFILSLASTMVFGAALILGIDLIGEHIIVAGVSEAYLVLFIIVGLAMEKLAKRKICK